jgi:hypothetical protein
VIEHIGKYGGGRTAAKSTNFPPGLEKRMGRWRRFRDSRLDSVDDDDPGYKVELLVVSARHGMVRGDGASAT